MFNTMFEPDKCGDRRGKSCLVCRQDEGGQSYLHRFIVKPDSPVKVEIHQNEIYSGNMNHDWELLKPKITPPTLMTNKGK